MVFATLHHDPGAAELAGACLQPFSRPHPATGWCRIPGPTKVGPGWQKGPRERRNPTGAVLQLRGSSLGPTLADTGIDEGPETRVLSFC